MLNARDALRRHLPEPVRAVLRYYYTESRLLMTSISDVIARQPNDEQPIPPPRLRFRVHGHYERDGFLRMGERCAKDIESALKATGTRISDFQRVLDFGCGCGRVLRNFTSHREQKFSGVDIDPQAIQWCQQSLRFADFRSISPLPPLPYGEAEFDFIYAISVFTHLDEDYQRSWLPELYRVARPGGIVLITTLGDSTSILSNEEVRAFRSSGFIFKIFRTGRYKIDGLPDFYQSALQTTEHFLSASTKYFKAEACIERGMANHQDVFVLRKSA